jgi:hypothetical protein
LTAKREKIEIDKAHSSANKEFCRQLFFAESVIRLSPFFHVTTEQHKQKTAVSKRVYISLAEVKSSHFDIL